jgi:hypothetical protein
MLRLYPQADTQDFSRLYDSLDAFAAHPLHSVGQELSTRVSLKSLPTRILHHRRFISYDRQLFGEDEDASGELDEAEKQGENGM